MLTDQKRLRNHEEDVYGLLRGTLRTSLHKFSHMPTNRVIVVSRRHSENSEFFQRLLRMGYQPTVVQNQESAVHAVELEQPSAMILDAHYPESTGVEILEELKRRRLSCPCVVLGGGLNSFSSIRSFYDGPVHYAPQEGTGEFDEQLDIILESLKLRQEKDEIRKELERSNRNIIELSQRLRMISDSAKTLSRTLNIEKIGPRLLEDFARNMSAQGGSLFVNRRNELILVHTLDTQQPVPRTIPFPLRKDSPFDRALHEKKPVIHADYAPVRAITRSGWDGYRDDSFLVAPLMWDAGELIGLISLHNKVNPPFSAIDRDVGAVLASLVSESLRTARALEALRESEERYRILVEHATDGILLQSGGRYIYANRAILDMLGYTEEEFLKLKFTDVMAETPLGREYILKMYRDRMAGRPVPNRYEAQYVTKKGEILDVMLSVSRITYGGADGVTIIVTDITDRKRADIERKRLESQLLQSQKLESIGRLAGGVAHDFNNILSAILGYSEMAIIQLPEDHPAKDKVKTIRRAGQKAAALTKQLLAFSRKQVLEIKATDLNYVIEHLGKMLSRMIGEDISLEINTAPAVRSVMADSGQIEQVIMNLAVNARDAMPRGGSLTIETANLDVRPGGKPFGDNVNPGSYVLVTVTDTGHGMDRETVEHIFEPFFTTKEVGEGTGLGLATVYGIIKQHEGFIFVSSEKNVGTTFRVYLPAVHTKAENGQAETAPGPFVMGTETVLVVDDEPTIRQLCMDILKPLGYTVIAAASGREALQKLDAHPGRVDLLLTDVIMPGMNGRELADAFLKRMPESKVVFMSGYMEKNFDLGPYAGDELSLIPKPLTGSQLTSTLRRVLEPKK